MPPRNFLVPVDGSAHAEAAVAYAADLAEVCGARVSVIHVMRDAGSYMPAEGLSELTQIEHIGITEHDVLVAAAEKIIAQATSKAAQCEPDRLSSEIRVGDPTHEIVGYAKEHGVDLIVMGSRGLGDFKGLLLGSVSHKVVQLADCPCLLVRGQAAPS